MKLIEITRTFLVVAFVFFTSSATGQIFFDGYIIKDGEKQNGFISYVPTRNSNGNIQFKISKNATPESFSSEQVKEFYIEKFNSAFIAFKENATGKVIYTEIQIRGELTLSYFGNLYVISKTNGENLQIYIPLSKSIHDASPQDPKAAKLLEVKTIGMIKLFVSDCSGTKTEDAVSELFHVTKNTLVRIVKSYNDCKGVPSVKRKGSSISYGILAGFNYASVKFDQPYVNSFSPKLNYEFGVTIDFLPMSFYKKGVVSIQALIVRNSFKLDDLHASYINGVNIDNTTLRIPIGVKLYTRSGQTGFFFNAAVSPNFYLQRDQKSDIVDNGSMSASAIGGIGWRTLLSKRNGIAASFNYEHSIVAPFSIPSSLSSLKADIILIF